MPTPGSLLSTAMASLLSPLAACFRRFLLWVLAAGPIPAHLAIIMDGNRRFADRRVLDRHSSHAIGYEILLSTLRDCLDLGIRVVTVYAFSIHNFRRSPQQVSAIMDFMRDKFDALAGQEPLLRSYGVCVRVLGDLSLLPEDVRAAAERAAAATCGNRFAILNICVAYTSTSEIVHSVRRVRGEFVSKFDGSLGNDEPSEKSPSVDSRNGKCGWNSVLYNCENASSRSYILRRRNRWKQISGSWPYGGTAEFVNGHIHFGTEFASKLMSLDNELLNGHTNSDAQLENGFLSAQDLPLVGDDEFPCPAKNEAHSNFISSVLSKENAENGCTFKMMDSKLNNACGKHNPKDGDWPESVCEACRTENVPGSEKSKGNSENNEAIPSHLLNTVLDTVTTERIDSNLYTSLDPPPDLLIRTSGETRLSNFLMWQSSFSHLSFCKVLWPEFSFRHLFWVILEYQRAYPSLIEKRRLHEQSSSRNCEDLCQCNKPNGLHIPCRKLEAGGSDITSRACNL